MNKRVDFVSGGYYILTDEEQQIYEICGDTWLDEYCRYISDTVSSLLIHCFSINVVL